MTEIMAAYCTKLESNKIGLHNTYNEANISVYKLTTMI
jgi:hypothetical protein